MSESLDFIATALEKAVGPAPDEARLNKAIQDLLPGILKESKKIVFNGASRQGSDIYIANRDGTHVKQVTHEGTNVDPTWGPHPAWK